MHSVGAGWIAVDGFPVLICTRPELKESFLHPWEGNVVGVTGCSVEFVPFRVFVCIVISDECEVFESTQVQCVLPARGVSIFVVFRSTTFSTRPASTCVYRKAILGPFRVCWSDSQHDKSVGSFPNIGLIGEQYQSCDLTRLISLSRSIQRGQPDSQLVCVQVGRSVPPTVLYCGAGTATRGEGVQ